MRKTLLAAATATALTLGATSVTVAPSAVAQQNGQAGSGSSNSNATNPGTGQTDGSSAVKGIEAAFSPEAWAKPESAKDFFQKAFQPYGDMFSGDIEKSSKGATKAIIQYFIIAAGITVIGQIIQLIMKNLPR